MPMSDDAELAVQEGTRRKDCMHHLVNPNAVTGGNASAIPLERPSNSAIEVGRINRAQQAIVQDIRVLQFRDLRIQNTDQHRMIKLFGVFTQSACNLSDPCFRSPTKQSSNIESRRTCVGTWWM